MVNNQIMKGHYFRDGKYSSPDNYVLDPSYTDLSSAMGLDIRFFYDECLIGDIDGSDSSIFPTGLTHRYPSVEFPSSNSGTYATFIYTKCLACLDSGRLTYTIDAPAQ